jgi:hypothetical protein
MEMTVYEDLRADTGPDWRTAEIECVICHAHVMVVAKLDVGYPLLCRGHSLLLLAHPRLYENGVLVTRVADRVVC